MDNNETPEISPQQAVGTFFGMVAVAMLVTLKVSHNPKAIEAALAFPIGLVSAVGIVIQFFSPNTDLRALNSFALVLGSYFVYGLLLSIFCVIRTRRIFLIACVILAALLLINIVGCQPEARRFPGIE